MNLEANIRWADAFILMYSVTDKCSFDECNRLKFLINYNKRRKKIGSNYKVRNWMECDVNNFISNSQNVPSPDS